MFTETLVGNIFLIKQTESIPGQGTEMRDILGDILAITATHDERIIVL